VSRVFDTPPIGASLVQARSARWRLRWIGAIALLVIAAPIIYLLTRDSSDAVAGAGAPAPVPTPPVAVPPPLPTPGPGSAAPDPPPALAKVHIRITTRPSDASVWLDSKRLGHTPYDEIVPADPGKHVIKLRRKGYAQHKLDVALDSDITEDIQLTPQK
jgi:hypothetical protein